MKNILFQEWEMFHQNPCEEINIDNPEGFYVIKSAENSLAHPIAFVPATMMGEEIATLILQLNKFISTYCVKNDS